jgi:hypothetical protein
MLCWEELLRKSLMKNLIVMNPFSANNMENFASSVSDLDRILEINPEHKRTLTIIDKVLVQQAEK